MEKWYSGHVHRVIDANTLDVLLNLGLGVFVKRVVKVDGLHVGGSPDKTAAHCLVVLVGGKEAWFSVVHGGETGTLVCKVYTQEYQPASPDLQLVQIPPTNAPCLNIGACMQWIAAHDFDAKLLRQTLK